MRQRNGRPAAVLQLRAVKLVIAIVRPERANHVLEALYRADVRGLSMTRVQGHGGEIDRVETYRGTTVKMELSEKVRFEIGVSDHFVEPTVQGDHRGRADGRGRRREDLRAAGRPGDPHPHRRDRHRRRHARRARVIALRTSAATATIDTGDTAWMLTATALVLLMTPALGLFYAGLVRSKNTLNTFMMSIAALGAVTITWAIVAYSLAFSGNGAFIGNLDNAFLRDVGLDATRGLTIPDLLFMAYQATFCIITAALISGAVVERMRFAAVHGLHGRCGRASSTRRWRTGSGAAAGSPSTARSTGPAACRSRWRRASRRSRPRSSSARARTTGGRPCCRTTASTC